MNESEGKIRNSSRCFNFNSYSSYFSFLRSPSDSFPDCGSILTFEKMTHACSDCAQTFRGKCVVSADPGKKCEKCSQNPKPTTKIVRPGATDVAGMLVELKKELKSFQAGLIDSMKRLHAKIDANAKMFEEQTKKLAECFDVIRCLKKDNEDLRTDVETIKRRQTEADQKSRQNDLEIRGVPCQPNENIVGVLQSLALALQSPLIIDERCIVFCYRARPKEGSPGTIHVRFVDHFYKYDLLRRRCAYRGFNSTLMTSLPVTSRSSVFVNEALCPERRVLFKKADELRRQKKYRYIWTREGRILVRMSDRCRVIAINCLADLDKL